MLANWAPPRPDESPQRSAHFSAPTVLDADLGTGRIADPAFLNQFFWFRVADGKRSMPGGNAPGISSDLLWISHPFRWQEP
ncbi:hypothetical protein N9K37_05005 [Pseudomonadales bacterium]|nr:hypothetical protein [Pseudomonadales bacterium]MDB9943248.1 hypothetical protein [Pseudomonadales bacterium]